MATTAATAPPAAEADERLDASKLLPAAAVPAGATPVLLVACGALNPVHTGHLEAVAAARAALEAGGCPALGAAAVVGAFLSPVNDAYAKPGLAPFAYRARVLDAALAGDALAAADRWEGEQPAYQRSHTVMSRLGRAAAAHYRRGGGAAGEAVAQRLTVCLVCGADLFESFYRPGCWRLDLLRRIFTEMTVCAIARDGVDPRAIMAAAAPIPADGSEGPAGPPLDLRDLAGRVAVAQLSPPNAASSTEIRRRLAAGEPVPPSMVPPAAAAVLAEPGCPYAATPATGST